MRMLHLLSALAVSSLVIGCATPKRASAELMPFHVAVAPILTAAADDSGAPPEDPADIHLVFDEVLLTEALRAQLEERCFSQVTLLPTEVAGEGASLQLTKADWARYAFEETDADILLTFELKYDSRLEEEMNGWFAAGLPFFLLGGPFCWFFPDRSYSTDVKLRLEAFDLSGVPGRWGQVGTTEASAAMLEEAFSMEPFFGHTSVLDEMELDFLDRAGDSYGYHFASILIPSGFLAADHEGLEEDLPEMATSQLVEGIAEETYRLGSGLLHDEVHHHFYLDQDLTRVNVGEGETLSLDWTINLLKGQDHNVPRAYRIAVGSYSKVYQVNEMDLAVASEAAVGAPPGYLRFSFHEEVPLSAGASHLHLTVDAGDRTPLRRKYTFAVPGGAEGLGGSDGKLQ